jgi:hypothetical protein
MRLTKAELVALADILAPPPSTLSPAESTLSVLGNLLRCVLHGGRGIGESKGLLREAMGPDWKTDKPADIAARLRAAAERREE